MNENGNLENPFSTDAIRLYLEGKLSAGQMHALEKAAMEDPFLADAIEGMQIRMQLRDGSFEEDIRDLGQKLYERVHDGDKKNKLIPLLMTWRGAAAIFLLGGSIFFSYRFLFQVKSVTKPISIAEKKEPVSAQTPTSDTSAGTGQKISTVVEDKDKSAPSEKSNSQILKEKQTVPLSKKNDSIDFVADDSKKSNDQNFIKKEYNRQTPMEKPLTRSEPNIPETSAKIVSAADGRASGVAIQPAAAVGNYVFHGRVIDHRHQPVIGASIGLKNKKASAVTDEQGRFRLKTNNSDSNAIVVINSVGYQPVSRVLSADSADNLVQLSLSSTSLNEVVVAGYNSRKKQDSADDDVNDVLPGNNTIRVEKAIPANGWSDYASYLKKNKKISNVDSALHGDEIVSFLVGSNGNLSEFKIVRSISPSHDAEAIRLLSNGPGWKLLRGKKQRTTITFKF